MVQAQPWYEFFDHMAEIFQNNKEMFTETVLIADAALPRGHRETQIVDFGLLNPVDETSRLLLDSEGNWMVVRSLKGYPFQERVFEVIPKSDEYHIWNYYGIKRVMLLINTFLSRTNDQLESEIAKLSLQRQHIIESQVALNIAAQDWIKESI